MVAALIGVAGFAYYVQSSPGAARVSDDLRRPEQVSQPSPRVEVSTRPSRKPEVVKSKFLIPVMVNGDVSLAGDLGNAPDGQDEKAFVVTKTFESMGVTDGRALKVEVKGRLALVDVNAKMAEHGYGSMEEGQMIKALQLALGQFPEIDKFQLLSEGQPVELGHIDLSEPVEVIRPQSEDLSQAH